MIYFFFLLLFLSPIVITKYYIILTNKLVLNIINSYYINISLLRGSPARRQQNMFSIDTTMIDNGHFY